MAAPTPLVLEVMVLEATPIEDAWCPNCNLPAVYSAIIAVINPKTLRLHATIEVEACTDCRYRRNMKKPKK